MDEGDHNAARAKTPDCIYAVESDNAIVIAVIEANKKVSERSGKANGRRGNVDSMKTAKSRYKDQRTRGIGNVYLDELHHSAS